MKSIKKIITAAAAAAVIATVGATSAFAVSDAASSNDGLNNQVVGNYMAFDWGGGYATVTNMTTNLRRCFASVDVYDNETGDPVPNAATFNAGDCTYNQSVTARVNSSYISSKNNYTCTGYIHGGTSANTPIIEKETRIYKY